MDGLSQRGEYFPLQATHQIWLCSLIVDSESCGNISSATLVKFLKLPTTKHATPNKLQRLSECGEFRVNKTSVDQIQNLDVPKWNSYVI